MNLDRKFLEGFSEVSAANGLPPSQAHQLLMKEAKLGALSKLLIGGAATAGVVSIPTATYFGGKALLNKFNEGMVNLGNRQKETDRPKHFAEQQRQYESAYTAAERARENAMK